MAATRPLTPRDLDQAVAVFLDAFEIGETSLAAYLRARFSHVLESDPQGAWVAVDGADNVTGVATAIRRGRLWSLSILAVAKRAQSGGAGSESFGRALGYAHRGDARLIISSDDPRAQRLYSQAGLHPRPALEGKGRIDRGRLPETAGVSAAGIELARRGAIFTSGAVPSWDLFLPNPAFG